MTLKFEPDVDVAGPARSDLLNIPEVRELYNTIVQESLPEGERAVIVLDSKTLNRVPGIQQLMESNKDIHASVAHILRNAIKKMPQYRIQRKGAVIRLRWRTARKKKR